MGFIDNNQIVVDAVLTKKGRELLRKGQFNVTKFALGDDEINYRLTDRQIQATPILQPSSDQNTALISRLVTLAADTTVISQLQLSAQGFVFNNNVLTLTLKVNQSITINVKNNQDLDIVFDVVVQDTSHLFVNDAVPTIVNNVRTFSLKAKKVGNSRVQVIGRQTGRIRYINVSSTES